MLEQQMLNKPKFSVIVPVYNSEQTLDELITRIENVMQAYLPYELLLIDDFSNDNSWEKLKALKQNRTHIRLLRLTKNFGQAAVHVCGINEAKADIMISIDDDLQFPPEEIPKLIEAFNPKTHYLLCGVPESKKNGNPKGLTSKLTDILINKIILKNKDSLQFSSFRILTKIAPRRENYNESRMKGVPIFFKMVSPKLMTHVYVKHHARKKGKSNYSFFKRLSLALDLIFITTELHAYLFIFLFLSFGITAVLTSILIIFNLINDSLNQLFIPISIMGFSFMFLSFVILLKYVRQLYLSHLGAEMYAIWEEA